MNIIKSVIYFCKLFSEQVSHRINIFYYAKGEFSNSYTILVQPIRTCNFMYVNGFFLNFSEFDEESVKKIENFIELTDQLHTINLVVEYKDLESLENILSKMKYCPLISSIFILDFKNIYMFCGMIDSLKLQFENVDIYGIHHNESNLIKHDLTNANFGYVYIERKVRVSVLLRLLFFFSSSLIIFMLYKLLNIIIIIVCTKDPILLSCILDYVRQEKYQQFKDKFPDNNTCNICMDEFEDNQMSRILPCNHFFHSNCIDPWLTIKSAKCPLCRQLIFHEI